MKSQIENPRFYIEFTVNGGSVQITNCQASCPARAMVEVRTLFGNIRTRRRDETTVEFLEVTNYENLV